MSDLREQFSFGSGSYVGKASEIDLFGLPTVEQARIMGWVNGCPIVQELTDPNNPNPKRGLEAMLKRYGEVNFWYGQLLREADEINHDLFQKLTAPLIRRRMPTKYEDISVPVSYFEKIAPMDTPWGYGLGRVFIEWLNAPYTAPDTATDHTLNLANALGKFQELAKRSTEPATLLVLFSEEAVIAGVEPNRVLTHALSAGKLLEENYLLLYRTVYHKMRTHCPRLSHAYDSLLPTERSELDIINF